MLTGCFFMRQFARVSRGKVPSGRGPRIIGLAQLLMHRGRIGIDRTVGSDGGVSWLIRRPRKNLIKTLIAEDNSFAMAA